MSVGYVYTPRYAPLETKGILRCYTHIAWAISELLVLTVMGNAKASECGTSNWYRFPRFFFLYAPLYFSYMNRPVRESAGNKYL